MHPQNLVMALVFLYALTASATVNATSDTPDSADTGSVTDYIFLKNTQDGLGYRKVPGEVVDATKDYVLFSAEGKKDVHLYTRDEVRRIEVGDDDKRLRSLVSRYWNEQRNLQRGERGFWEWSADIVTELLPGGILISVLVFVGLYFVVSATFQAYQRFVLESHIKRLNTAKLVSEIDKLRFEVIDLRKRLGLPIADTAPSAHSEDSAYTEAVAEKPRRVEHKAATLSNIHFPDFPFVQFMKHTVLGVPNETKFSAAKIRLVRQWQKARERNEAWFKLRYALYSLSTFTVMLIAWLFILGTVGPILLLFVDPIYREELGGGGYAIVMLLMAAGLVMAVTRLRYSRKIRRAAYEEVIDGEDHEAGNEDPHPLGRS